VSADTRTASRTQGRRFSLHKLRDHRDGYLFILPWLIGFLLWTAGPMLFAVYISLTNWRIIGKAQFVGIAQFAKLFQDDRFYTTLYNTTFYVVLGVPTHLVLALLVALLMNINVRGIAFYRTLYYLPSITPAVANAILWLWILNSDYGIANWLLTVLHLPKVLWLQDPRVAKVSLVLMSYWGIGGQMVILLAGLQGVPQHLYDAASIDGANWWRRFWSVTLPLLTPSLFFNLIMALIGAFQVFTQAYIITGGGPENSTLFYVLYLYRVAFQNFDMGYAAALAWVLFVIILAITLLQFRLGNRWVFYEAELRR
jgi:multiple sugar transport system permease protein